MSLDRIAVLALVQGDKILLSQRSLEASWAPGVWHVPGGVVEMGEDVEKAAVREAFEEMGVRVKIDDLTFRGVVAYNQSSERHVDTFCFSTDKWSGEPSIMEPEKCVDMGWFPINEMPGNLTEHARVIYGSDQSVFVRVYDGEVMNKIQSS